MRKNLKIVKIEFFKQHVFRAEKLIYDVVFSPQEKVLKIIPIFAENKCFYSQFFSGLYWL